MERIEEIKQYVETMRALHSNHGAVDKLEYLLAVIEERDKRIELMTLTETEREHLLRQLKYNQSKAKQANTELSAATKLAESLEKQIMTLAKEKEQTEAELEHLKSTRLESGRMVAEAIKKQEQAEARVKELEKEKAQLIYELETASKESIFLHRINQLKERLASAREGLEETKRILTMGHTQRERSAFYQIELTLKKIAEQYQKPTRKENKTNGADD